MPLVSSILGFPEENGILRESADVDVGPLPWGKSNGGGLEGPSCAIFFFRGG